MEAELRGYQHCLGTGTFSAGLHTRDLCRLVVPTHGRGKSLGRVAHTMTNMEYRPLETDLRITSSGLGACQHLAFNAEMMGERVEGEPHISDHVPVLFVAHHEVV